MLDFQKNPFLKEEKVKKRPEVVGKRDIVDIRIEMSEINIDGHKIRIPEPLEQRKDGLPKIEFTINKESLKKERLLKEGKHNKEEERHSTNYAIQNSNLISNNKGITSEKQYKKNEIDIGFDKMNVFRNKN